MNLKNAKWKSARCDGMYIDWRSIWRCINLLEEARPSDMLVFGTRKYLWSTVLEQRPSSLTPSVAVSTLPVDVPRLGTPKIIDWFMSFFLGGEPMVGVFPISGSLDTTCLRFQVKLYTQHKPFQTCKRTSNGSKWRTCRDSPGRLRFWTWWI